MSEEKNSQILLVEDDKFLRGLLARKLEACGYQIETAITGEEAVKKAKEKTPQLILLDLVLPGIDGFEALAMIKSDDKLKAVPVLILSNLGQREEVEKGLKLGAEDYIIKAHFTPDEIIAKVKQHIK